MLPYEVNGLPLHILLVHVVVIVLPAAAVLTVLGALWPAFRRKLGVLTPIVALVGLVSVPLSTSAGQWLEQRVNPSPLIQAHAALGETLLPWAVAQFVVATAIWGWYRWFAALPVAPGERSASGARGSSVAAPVSRGASGSSGASGASGVDAFGAPGFATPGAPDSARAAGAAGVRATDGSVLLHGEDPYATPPAGRAAATPGIRPTAPPRARAGRGISVVVMIAAIFVALAVSTGTIVTVVQIGESGSNAVWQGSFSSDPVTGG